MIKHPKRILWTAVFVAWFFDFLFWEKNPGVSFVIFIATILIAGIILAWKEGVQPANASLWLLLPVSAFACGTFLRREPFTTFTNFLLTLVSLGIFAQTFINGRWIKYSISDYFATFLSLLFAAFSQPIVFFQKTKTNDVESGLAIETSSKWKRGFSYLRGLLIALPVLTVFASLFASADPIFADYLEDFVGMFKLEKLPEYIFRGFYISIFAYLLAGIYLHAYTNKKDESLIGEEKPWIPKFLGFPESSIVLGSVNLLFSLFVGIQFRYFFGGQSNINIDGFTYASYARRGFNELIIVSVFSLLLFLGMSTICKRENNTQKRVFSALGVALVLLVVVILISAFQRLWLYEQAYGFTRLRAYSHLFMIWLGVLLMAVVILELSHQQRAFALASFLTAIGFVMCLNLMNVDGFIVDQNVKRALIKTEVNEVGEEEDIDESLDAAYLYSLSSDAVPALMRAQQNQQLSAPIRGEIRAILACQFAEIAELRDQKIWQSFHVADERAYQLLAERGNEISGTKVYKRDGYWWVNVNNIDRSCNDGAFRSDSP